VSWNWNTACALLSDGTLRCWGDNENGQLGNNDAPNDAGAPVNVMTLTGVVSVSAGEQHTCAALANDTVWCWGLNTDGQLGTGNNNPSPVPVQVVGL
jgi:alpha-tubulin suppressor-like RCC1 family protein